MHEHDLLDRVVAELTARVGELPRVARESGVHYDTVLRIKNRENDPGYSKVRALAEYLFEPQRAAGAPGRAQLAELIDSDGSARSEAAAAATRETA